MKLSFSGFPLYLYREGVTGFFIDVYIYFFFQSFWLILLIHQLYLILLTIMPAGCRWSSCQHWNSCAQLCSESFREGKKVTSFIDVYVLSCSFKNCFSLSGFFSIRLHVQLPLKRCYSQLWLWLYSSTGNFCCQYNTHTHTHRQPWLMICWVIFSLYCWAAFSTSSSLWWILHNVI